MGSNPHHHRPRDRGSEPSGLVAGRSLARLLEGPFDPEIRSSSQPPTAPSPPVRIGDSTTVNWAPIFSPDGSKILYFVGLLGRGDRGHEPRRDRSSDPQRGASSRKSTRPSWHPDGNRIVVSATTYALPRDLWILHLDGSPDRHLEVPGRAEVGPSWSPTGDRLAYLSSIVDSLVSPSTWPTPTVPTSDRCPARTATSIPPGLLTASASRPSTTSARSYASRSSTRTAMLRRSSSRAILPADSVIADRSSPTSWQRVAP